MSSLKSFKDLNVWKKGIELVKEIYFFTSKFPKEEFFGLSQQMRRCAVSVPSNIAEGFRRSSLKEFKHYLSITLGSFAELETQLIISKELGYLQINVFEEIQELIDHISRMAAKLKMNLKPRKSI